MKRVTFNRYVKHNQTRYKTGETAEVSDEEYKGLISAGVVDSYEDIVPPKEPPDNQDDAKNPFSMSPEELDKAYKITDLKAILDAEKFEYSSDAKKADLIELIVGE